MTTLIDAAERIETVRPDGDGLREVVGEGYHSNQSLRNRRRVRGARGQRLLRLRGERLERPLAHLYETGGMRRLHLRGHTNILKRLLIHIGAFNLGLLMRRLIGVGTPRGLQGRVYALIGLLLPLTRALWRLATGHWRSSRLVSTPERASIARYERAFIGAMKIAFTTGC